MKLNICFSTAVQIKHSVTVAAPPPFLSDSVLQSEPQVCVSLRVEGEGVHIKPPPATPQPETCRAPQRRPAHQTVGSKVDGKGHPVMLSLSLFSPLWLYLLHVEPHAQHLKLKFCSFGSRYASTGALHLQRTAFSYTL
ncbi:hypothetical protein MHYP_G00062870 [Metynnis hypsauchen]